MSALILCVSMNKQRWMGFTCALLSAGSSSIFVQRRKTSVYCVININSHRCTKDPHLKCSSESGLCWLLGLGLGWLVGVGQCSLTKFLVGRVLLCLRLRKSRTDHQCAVRVACDCQNRWMCWDCMSAQVHLVGMIVAGGNENRAGASGLGLRYLWHGVRHAR